MAKSIGMVSSRGLANDTRALGRSRRSAAKKRRPVKLPPPRADDLDSAEALIEEARRRHRKRRAWTAVAVLAAASLVAGLLAALGGSPPSGPMATASRASGRPSSAPQGRIGDHAVTVSSVALPVNDQLSKLAVVNGQLIAYGEYYKAIGPSTTQCVETVVQSAPLKLSSAHSYDCTIPVPGETAAAFYQPLGGKAPYDDDLAGPGSVTVNARLQIARADTSTGKTALGPVVMKFAGISDTWPASIDTASSVWAYDCAAGGLNGDGEAIQASASVGAVKTSVTMPSICHSSIGADSAGAFVASYDGPGPIYFVPNGATHARVALAGAGSVGWFFADGDSMYVAVGDQGGQPAECRTYKCGIWRFTGPNATPKLLTSDRTADLQVVQPVDGGSLGLLSVIPSSSTESASTTTFRVVSIDPSSGAQRSLATFRVPGGNDYPPTSVAFLGHALYVLVPSSVIALAGTLYRFGFS
jgi:hypothetical protein